jgi:hypothetical protein
MVHPVRITFRREPQRQVIWVLSLYRFQNVLSEVEFPEIIPLTGGKKCKPARLVIFSGLTDPK